MDGLNNNFDRLVCIFQRGAADGLNSLVPYADPDYYVHRGNPEAPEGDLPAIGMAQSELIDLDGFFGLHPALAPLAPLYTSGQLGLIHATGIPHGSRSHFTAQDLVERGIDNRDGVQSGWLGRYLSEVPAQTATAFRAVGISGNVPVSLSGSSAEVLAISNINEFQFDQNIINLGYPNTLQSLYADSIPFSSPAQAALAALGELQSANLSGIDTLEYPNTDLGNKLKQASQLLKSDDIPVEIICMDSGGWDHHENLPIYLNASLTEMAAALATFYEDMGSAMSHTLVVIMTEFGRRVMRNGSVGVDHGTGGLAYVIGGGVNGGQIIGSGNSWPGLDISNLTGGEDLAITTDLRSVLSELLLKRLQATSTDAIFSDFTGPTDLNLFFPQ